MISSNWSGSRGYSGGARKNFSNASTQKKNSAIAADTSSAAADATEVVAGASAVYARSSAAPTPAMSCAAAVTPSGTTFTNAFTSDNGFSPTVDEPGVTASG